MDTAQPAGNVASAYSSVGKESTQQEERALLGLVSAGDRCAMVNLYVSYFTRLANFFLHLTAHADLVEELINDTMVEVWKEGASIGANGSVSLAIMALAYSRGRRRFAEAAATRLHAQPVIQEADHDSHFPTTSHIPTTPTRFSSKASLRGEGGAASCLCERALTARCRLHNEHFVRMRGRAVG
jgi:hypothetical protein